MIVADFFLKLSMFKPSLICIRLDSSNNLIDDSSFINFRFSLQKFSQLHQNLKMNLLRVIKNVIQNFSDDQIRIFCLHLSENVLKITKFLLWSRCLDQVLFESIRFSSDYFFVMIKTKSLVLLWLNVCFD